MFDVSQSADAFFTDDGWDEKIRPVVLNRPVAKIRIIGGMAYFVSSAVSAMCQMKSAVKYAR